jgi:HK97 family phage major capsid protein
MGKVDLAALRRAQIEDGSALRVLMDKTEVEQRDMTADEMKQYDEIEQRMEARRERIVREERLRAHETALSAPAGQPATRPQPGDGDTAPAARSVVQEEVRCMIRKADGSYQEGRVINPVKEFRTFGEQLTAVIRAGRTGEIDPRLLNLRAVSGASEIVPADGGFLVQQDFAGEILQRSYEMGQVLSRCRRIPIGPNSNGLKIPAIDESTRATGSRWGGVQVYRTAEGGDLTGKKPKFRLMELSLKKMTGLAYATDELLQDSTALEAIFSQAFQEELTFSIENEIINGQGAGQMLGILNAAATVSISAEGSQVATTFVAENAMKMWARCWGRSRPNAVWFINQDVEPQLYQMNVKIKNVAGSENVGGMPVYLQAGTIAGQQYSTLFGRPVIPIEYCATLGTVGDVILADMSQYIVIDKGGVQSASSMHVRFLNDEQTFRWVVRNDGQPSWHAALTPFKGSATQSPFVTVATRS